MTLAICCMGSFHRKRTERTGATIFAACAISKLVDLEGDRGLKPTGVTDYRMGCDAVL